jgi:hypothetical protein
VRLELRGVIYRQDVALKDKKFSGSQAFESVFRKATALRAATINPGAEWSRDKPSPTKTETFVQLRLLLETSHDRDESKEEGELRLNLSVPRP